ncbi:hypothetical protein CVT24_000555 [Panaeolus cyanescens]|uniref:Extracellular membrane protein CFEM domain-containing protein n=1 Tax=Panaeolus cyanescens TaxID=181874 RepID=A0A409VX96_9AGAR|nr:hypothetical protein CVT24_000555 [Panaeolus cyanescens]
MVAIFGLAATFLLSVVAVNAQLPANLPASCLSGTCKALADKFTSTTSGGALCAADPACFCSSDVAKGLADCYKCAAAVIDQKTIDDALTAYSDGCKSTGHNVDVTGGSGGNSNGSGNGGNTGGASSLQISSFAAAAALGGLVFL